MRRRPPSSTRTDTLCPDTTLVRSLAGLPPGTYRVDVTADGQTSSQTLTLAVGQTVTLNLGLGGVPETGPAGEATDLDTVVVTAPAMVETKTSEVAPYVTQKQIDSLDRKSVVEGKSVSVRGDLGGRLIDKNKN